MTLAPILSIAAPADDRPSALLDCNYSLHGLPTPRCPECGREFDPLDPATMNMGRELSPLAKWVLGPMRWPVNLLSWGALAFSLWSARLPGGQVGASLSVVILLALSVLWLAWPVVRVMAARKYGWPHSLLMRGQKQRVAVGRACCWRRSRSSIPPPDARGDRRRRPAMESSRRRRSRDQPLRQRPMVGPSRRRASSRSPAGALYSRGEERAYKAGFAYSPTSIPSAWVVAEKLPPRRRRMVGVAGRG